MQDLENRYDREGAAVITFMIAALLLFLVVIAGTAVIKII